MSNATICAVAISGHPARVRCLIDLYRKQGRSNESIDRMLAAAGFPPQQVIIPKIIAPNDRRRVPRG